MIIGVPKEIKNHEYRVGANPELVYLLTQAGHTVYVEKEAGSAIGFSNEMYEKAGAVLKGHPDEVWAAEMVIKVKEPQPSEFPRMHPGLVLFCFLHLSAEPELTKALIERHVTAIAWETITNKQNQLPILIPMSEIAGRIAIQAGATSLQMSHGGSGLLLGGVPGVSPAQVVVIGAGIVGLNAARMAMGLGADVTVFDNNLDRLRNIDHWFDSRLKTLFSTKLAIANSLKTADLVIGSVLIPGKRAPKLVTREMVQQMPKGSVIVDVAIDQGGSCETSKPTSHASPTYEEEGVLHYCVTNMPGVCAKTATQALMNATAPYALSLANLGYQKALMADPGLLEGLNVYQGKVTNLHVAEDLGYSYQEKTHLFENAKHVSY